MRGDPSVNVGKGWGDVASTTLQPDAFEHSALRVAERCQHGCPRDLAFSGGDRVMAAKVTDKGRYKDAGPFSADCPSIQIVQGFEPETARFAGPLRLVEGSVLKSLGNSGCGSRNSRRRAATRAHDDRE